MATTEDTGLVVVAKIDGVTIARVRNVLIIWQAGEFTSAASRMLGTTAPRMLREYPGGLRNLLVVEDIGGPPSDEVRQMLAQNIAHGNARAMAVCARAEGFRAAVVTGVMTGLKAAAHSRMPLKVFSTIAEATEWLGTFADGAKPDGALLLSAFETLQARRA